MAICMAVYLVVVPPLMTVTPFPAPAAMMSTKLVLAAVCTLAVLGSSAAWNCVDTSVTWTGPPTPQPLPPSTNSTVSKNYCWKIGASSGSGAEQVGAAGLLRCCMGTNFQLLSS
jgi:hypothetical protein